MTPVAGVKTVLSPAQGAENACLQGRKGGIPAETKMGSVHLGNVG